MQANGEGKSQRVSQTHVVEKRNEKTWTKKIFKLCRYFLLIGITARGKFMPDAFLLQL